MRSLRIICRIIFGIVFIVSGTFKIIDPVGTGLIITEYLHSMHLAFLIGISIPIGIALSTLELILGFCILIGLKMRVISSVAFYLSIFFFFLTLYLALFNPISDCGCFGEAIHLTNWQTFFKDVILLLCIIPIYLTRKKFIPNTSIFVEWGVIVIICIFTSVVSLNALIRQPLLEFGSYKPGSDIAFELDEANQNVEYKTTLIYMKDGKKKSFTMTNLPDSTWTFVNSKSELIGKNGRKIFDFSLKNSKGDYITNSILSSDKPIFIEVISKIDKVNNKKFEEENIDLSKSIALNGGDFYYMSCENPEKVDTILPRGSKVLYTDYKTLIALHRSNGGVVYMNDATIVKKWAKGRLLPRNIKKILSDDYEVTIAKLSIKHQLIVELFFVLIFLIIGLEKIFSKKYIKEKK